MFIEYRTDFCEHRPCQRPGSSYCQSLTVFQTIHQSSPQVQTCTLKPSLERPDLGNHSIAQSGHARTITSIRNSRHQCTSQIGSRVGKIL